MLLNFFNKKNTYKKYNYYDTIGFYDNLIEKNILNTNFINNNRIFNLNTIKKCNYFELRKKTKYGMLSENKEMYFVFDYSIQLENGIFLKFEVENKLKSSIFEEGNFFNQLFEIFVKKNPNFDDYVFDNLHDEFSEYNFINNQSNIQKNKELLDFKKYIYENFLDIFNFYFLDKKQFTKKIKNRINGDGNLKVDIGKIRILNYNSFYNLKQQKINYLYSIKDELSSSKIEDFIKYKIKNDEYCNYILGNNSLNLDIDEMLEFSNILKTNNNLILLNNTILNKEDLTNIKKIEIYFKNEKFILSNKTNNKKDKQYFKKIINFLIKKLNDNFLIYKTEFTSNFDNIILEETLKQKKELLGFEKFNLDKDLQNMFKIFEENENLILKLEQNRKKLKDIKKNI